MPRAHVPYARLYASADSPLLPFLAPRIFIEFSIRREDKRHGTERRVREEAKKTAGRPDHATVPQHQSVTPSAARTGSRSTCHESLTSMLYGSAICMAGIKTRTSYSAANSLRSRYLDISDFARHQIRTYATRSLEGSSVVARTRERARLANRKSSALTKSSRTKAVRLRRISSKAKAPTMRQRPTPSPVESSRLKALMLEKFRLGALIEAHKGRSEIGLMEDGDYRSLRRRIINLTYGQSVLLDLSSLDAPPKHLATFAALDRRLYASIRKHTYRIRIAHHSMCHTWCEQIFDKVWTGGGRQVQSNWMAFDAGTRKAIFTPILTYLLDTKPGRATSFIQAIANDPQLEGMTTKRIADALGYLSKLHGNGVYTAKQGWPANTTKLAQRFGADFVHIYRRSLAGHERICSQDLLYNIATLTRVEDLRKVLDCLVDGEAFMNFDTMLHYASTFAQAGDTEYAFRCLQELKATFSSTLWSKVVRRERFLQTCAVIVRRSMTAGKKYHETPALVAALVELGVRLDLRLYNVVMHNAMDAGDYTTAFKVYNTLENNQLQANRYTHSILLHGCALQENPAMFSTFAEHCAQVALETRDPWLAANYIHYVYMLRRDDTDKSLMMDTLKHAAKRLFDTQSLSLILPGSEPTNPLLETSLETPRLTPPPVVVHFLMQAAIASASAINSRHVLQLYNRFKLLAQEENTPLAKLAQEPIMWNAFLHAFCKQEQYGNASQVIKDMTNQSVQPNVYSWNILMQGFFKTGQVQAAERVHEIMRTRGIEPDQYTYGVMVRGYSRAQLVQRVGEIMENIENEGELDPDLLTALSRLVDRGGLVAGLERARKAKEQKALLKVEMQAAEDKEKWDLPFETGLKDQQQETVITAKASKFDSAVSIYPLEPIEEPAPSHGSISQTARPPQPEEPTDSAQPIQPEKPMEPVRPEKPTEPVRPVQSLTPRKPIDLEAQYRQLQEQLGIASGASTSSASTQDTTPASTIRQDGISASKRKSTSRPKYTLRKTIERTRSSETKSSSTSPKAKPFRIRKFMAAGKL